MQSAPLAPADTPVEEAKPAVPRAPIAIGRSTPTAQGRVRERSAPAARRPAAEAPTALTGRATPASVGGRSGAPGGVTARGGTQGVGAVASRGPSSSGGTTGGTRALEFRSGTATSADTVLASWGTSDPAADLNGDGTVNATDLAYALGLMLQQSFSGDGGGDGSGPDDGDGAGEGSGNGGGGAEGQIATVGFEAGEPGTLTHSEFSWTVTNVIASGSFVDGSPWVVVGPGAELVDVSPRSERKRTYGGIDVSISGTAKNPRMRAYIDPAAPADFIRYAGPFDGRICRGAPTQSVVDAEYDHAANVGMAVPGSSSIAPVPLSAGDVVVTADSEWVADDTRAWNWNVPHVHGGKRTGIKRFGVLTVLAESPEGECFRPPLQWIDGSPSTRPAPIPTSQVSDAAMPIMHATGGNWNADALLTGPCFHDGDHILYQSSHAQYALSTAPATLTTSLTYGGTFVRSVLEQLLFASTDLGIPESERRSARNKLIQYGIDSHGVLMALGWTASGAGQRPAELKPWIQFAGQWLQSEDMIDVYGAIRRTYPGTAIAGMGDAELGRLFFTDDYVCRQVSSDSALGAPYRHRWGPGETYRVQGASLVGTTRLCGATEVAGTFARLELEGVVSHPDIHSRKRRNYFGMYLKILSGPGSGPKVYRVTDVGEASNQFAEWIELDGPWASGAPDTSSTVVMYPFRNGIVDDDTADLGRWYYSREGQSGTAVAQDCLSPESDIYAGICYRAFLAPYAALKRIKDVTGDGRLLAGTTWNWLAESVGGTGTAPNGVRHGSSPDSARILNLFWSDQWHSGLTSVTRPIVQGWLGDDADGQAYAAIDLGRLDGVE